MEARPQKEAPWPTEDRVFQRGLGGEGFKGVIWGYVVNMEKKMETTIL